MLERQRRVLVDVGGTLAAKGRLEPVEGLVRLAIQLTQPEKVFLDLDIHELVSEGRIALGVGALPVPHGAFVAVAVLHPFAFRPRSRPDSRLPRLAQAGGCRALSRSSLPGAA